MLEVCPPEVPLNCTPSAENALRRGTTLASVLDVLVDMQDVETMLAVLLEVAELAEDVIELAAELETIADEDETMADDVEELEDGDFEENAS
jgi:hypothetical protein